MRALLCGLLCFLVAACTPQSSRPDDVPAGPAREHAALVTLEPLDADGLDAALDAFAQWHAAYALAKPDERPAMEATGESLAIARARAMLTVVQADPMRALQLAMHPPERAQLPASIAGYVERWVDGVGSVDVISGSGSTDVEVPATEHYATIGADTMRAFLTGPRFTERSRSGIRLHGVTLGGLIALSDRPTRLLFPGESAREGLSWKSATKCPVSRKEVTPAAPTVDSGDSIYGLCVIDHAAALDDQLASEEDSFENEVLGSAWSTGPKTVLFIRVDFSDNTGDPVGQAAAQTLIDTTVNNYYLATSYNQTSMTGTVTPTLRLPQTAAFYKTNENYTGLRADALTVARDAGFNNLDYSLDIVAFKGIYSGWAGRGSVGGRGNWLNGYFDLRVTSHELGHNYGLWHANYWAATNNSIIGAGTNTEYGNPFDAMGNQGGNAHHFNAWFKRTLDWFTPAEAPTVTTSGTYRIQQIENAVTTGLHAIKVPRGDNSRDYWVEFRQAFGSNKSMSNGVSINWGYQYNTGAHLLDMTPTDGTRNDSALTFGRTFSDFNYGVHLTPLRKAGTTPEAVDVVVNLGKFPGNRAPTATMSASTTTPAVGAMVTFTATASDPDNDPLAYAWDFGDDEVYPSGPTVTRSFSAARAVFARVTVSDMKGQVVTKSVLLTVGAPITFTLRGSVEASGQPVEGARIGDGTRETFTDSSGVYALTNVPGGTYTLTASKLGYTFTPSFAVPVTVAANQMGLDFSGTAAAGYAVAGRVLVPPDAGIGAVTLSDGTRSASSAANGTFSIPSVPNGAYTLTASKPGWQFAPRPNVEVLGGNVGGLLIYPTGNTLSGQIVGATTAATITDGVRQVSATGNGSNWNYFVSYVANGSYNVSASLPGYTLTPQFTNPVVVSGQSKSGLNFTVTAGQTANVSGIVTTGGVPLPGVSVTDGTRTSTTDTLGRFVLVNVPAGTFTLTPTRAGVTFVPATRSVTVAMADIAGQDFTTTAVNPPPTVAMAASATPNPVTTGTTAQLSVLGADDSGESQLTYSWNTTIGSPPVFSANGTNAAKNTTATFPRAGTFALEVTITDPGGLSVKSAVSVVVQQTLISMAVTPLSANVLSGGTQQFNAQGKDQFGQFMYAGPYAWSVSGGGSISTNGLFTAGATAGGPHTITVTSGTGTMRTGTAVVTVVAAGSPVITRAMIEPKPIRGLSGTLTCTATDDGGEPALTYTWSSTAGPAPVTFAPNGTNAAKSGTATFTKAGTYQLMVTVLDGAGNMATALVDVEVEQVATALEVQPPAVTLQPGATQQFSANVDDQFGDPMLDQPTLTWSVSGGGTIDANGLFTAGMTPGGPFVVTATADTLSGTTSVTVMQMPDTRPPTVSITEPSDLSQHDVAFTAKVEATDDVGVAQVTLKLDGTALSTLTAAPYEWPVDPAALADGTHLLLATAVDAAGNSTDSAPVRFTVGMATMDEPPTVTMSLGTVSDFRLPVSITATDDVAVMTLQLEVDGAVQQTATTSPWSLDVTLTVGSHTLEAVAIDTAGNQARSGLQTVVVTASGEMMPGDKPTPPVVVGKVCGCSTGAGPMILLGILATALRRRRKIQLQ